jgi:tetratricopeptide (TPR) repeat protein
MSFMKMKAGLLGICLLGFTSVALAQTAEDYFDQGVKASEQGKHKSALNFFQKARKAGMKKMSLDYNQAVSYYRLGQYEQARKLFSRLIDSKDFEQLAYFNLGLIANKQKDEKVAVRWFQRAYNSGEDQKVRALAATALERLGAKPKRLSSKKSSWRGLASTSFVSDSNVNLATDEINQASKSDTSIELYASANQWLKGNRKDGLRLKLDVTSQTYSTETQYNYLQLSAGLTRYGQLGAWQTRFTGKWDEINIDGSSYERILNAIAYGHTNLSNDKQLRLHYRLSRIVATDSGTATTLGNDYLDGVRHQFRAGIQKRYGEKRVRAYYQLELNDRDDFDEAGYLFQSYSPTRHTLKVIGYFSVANWDARVDGRYRTSSYSDANEVSSGVFEKREDKQLRLSARLIREIAKNMEFEGRYTYTDNNSNLNTYDYDRSVIQAGLNWRF